MKKNRLSVFSISIALVLSACSGNSAPQSQAKTTSQEDNKSTAVIENSNKSEISNDATSSAISSTSSEEISSASNEESSAPKEEVNNDNFTILMPTNLSSMSDNCKKYVDDMRAQQQRLIQEKGANADYYLNDLYGTSGVDLTKGVTAGSNKNNQGGYRDGTTKNDYLDDVAAEWEKGEKSDESKGIEIEFEPAGSLKNKEYTITYSKAADFSDAKTITSTATKVYLKNLLVNQKYYVKVSADGKESSQINFTTGDYPRWIDARPMFNVRDHGNTIL